MSWKLLLLFLLKLNDSIFFDVNVPKGVPFRFTYAPDDKDEWRRILALINKSIWKIYWQARSELLWIKFVITTVGNFLLIIIIIVFLFGFFISTIIIIIRRSPYSNTGIATVIKSLWRKAWKAGRSGEGAIEKTNNSIILMY